jgi:hypothetical protein
VEARRCPRHLLPGGPSDLILLLYAYPKSVSTDLTPKQVAQLAKMVKQEFRDETEDV